MNRLFKLQIFRFFRDTQVFILGIIAFAYAFISAFVIGFLNFVSNSGSTSLFSSSRMILSSFSPFGMMVIIFPILIIVFFVREANYGTMRNQIVSGFSKGKIFIADALFILVVAIVFMLIYQLIMFGVLSVFKTPFFVDVYNHAIDPFHLTAGEVATYWGGFFVKYGLGWLNFLVLISILTSAILVFKNVPLPLMFSVVLPIIGMVAIFIGITIVSTNAPRTNDGATIQDLENYYNIIRNIAEFLPPYQSIVIGDLVGITESFQEVCVYQPGGNTCVPGLFTINTAFIVKTICTSLVLSSSFYVGGYFIFRKLDLK